MIADAGLSREAMPFYQLAVGTAHQQGDPALHSMLNWAAALCINDPRAPDAFNLNSATLKIAPTYSPAYFLQLVITRFNGDQDAYKKTLSEAGNAMGNRVVEIMNKMAPKDAIKATTRPINDPDPLSLPDLGPTAAELKANGTVEQKQEFIEAVADLVWLEGYFAQQPDAASKQVEALAGILPDDSPQLVRLRGWNDLMAGKVDDAKAKFLTVSAKDPLAELGLVKAMLQNPADKPAAESLGRRLLQDHPSGLLGALLFEQLHSDHVKQFPGSTSQAVALRALVAGFPNALLTAAEEPRNLYDLRITPYTVGSYTGDPLLANVEIRNVSEYDLTVGADGFIKPELMFKMSPDLDKRPTFDAFDYVAGPVVLPSHRRITQVVRVDQTPLLVFLNTQYEKVYNISGTLTTNRTAHGVGGFTAMFDKQFFRKPLGRE